MASHAVNYRGILAMIGGSACFAANDTATKFAAQYLPVTEIVALRAGFALVIALVVIAWRRELMAIAAIRNPYLILRGCIEAFIGILVVYALSKMPIANFTAIILIQPFVMTAIGALWLKEQVGWRRWTAVVAGFAGMLLVMKPATADFELVSLVALLAALLSLTRDLLVRRIHAQVPTTVITFSTALFAVPLGLMGAAVQPWEMPDAVAARDCHCGGISFCRLHPDRARLSRNGRLRSQSVPLFDHRLCLCLRRGRLRGNPRFRLAYRDRDDRGGRPLHAAPGTHPAARPARRNGDNRRSCGLMA
jgi:hypothetical protein